MSNESQTTWNSVLYRILEDKDTIAFYFDAKVRRHEQSHIRVGGGIESKIIAGYRRKYFESGESETLCLMCGRRSFVYALLDTAENGDTLTAFTQEDNWAYQYGDKCYDCHEHVPSQEPKWITQKRALDVHLERKEEADGLAK